MATTNGLRNDSQHPPLARDAQGNLLEIPDGTAAWRVCRQTTGRPKEIVGPDKRTMRFPLETTTEELVDLCGADVYRLYAVDEVGKVLDYVATVDVAREARELRNAPLVDVPMLLPSRGASSASSDLRFALEAMAQMMRVNSEALRYVAESQADYVKAFASVRGFFRNAAPTLPESIVDEEDDEDVESPQGKSIYDVLAPLAEHLAPSVKPIVSMLASGATAKQVDAASRAPKPGFELRELVDLNYAAAKGEAKRSAATASLQSRVMSDPKLMAHFVAIKALLEPTQAEQLFSIAERLNDREQEWLLDQVTDMSAKDAATLLRGTLAELNAARGK